METNQLFWTVLSSVSEDRTIRLVFPGVRSGDVKNRDRRHIGLLENAVYVQSEQHEHSETEYVMKQEATYEWSVSNQ